MSKRLKQSDQALALLYHARAATPFFSQGGEPCASVPSSVDSARVLPLRSADFRDWLTANYYSEYETAPSALALRAALRTLEARAQYGNRPPQKVDHRIGFEGDPFAPSKIFLDLANPAGEILEITSQGWRITDNLRRSFRQSPGSLALPKPQSAIPQPGPALAALFHLSPTAQVRTLFWLAAALRPTGPYPVLVLRGPASSGKSTFARALRTLIDPSTAPIRRLPRSDRELLQLARHNWILVFDQVHRIPVKISEALCAIASGEAIETAQPDHRESALTQIARPLVLIAPLDEAQVPWTPPRSLSMRSVTVDLPPLPDARLEASVWSDFETLAAPMLTWLADAAARALGNIRDVDIGPVARLSDSIAWAVSAAPVLGLDPGAIAEAVASPDAMWLGSDPLRDTLYALLESNSTWTGNSATLLARLRSLAPLAALPSTPKSLGQALARIPGITIARDGRVLSIARIDFQTTSAPIPNH